MGKAFAMLMVLALAALVGCAAFGGIRKMERSAESGPAGDGQANETQQSGMGNVAANLATSLKGVEYNSVLPIGVAVFLGLMCLAQMGLNAWGAMLSHAREKARIKRDGELWKMLIELKIDGKGLGCE